jgi:transcriptional regulator with XRE-family HTH domain
MRNEGVAEIARQLGCSKAYVSMVMSGKKKPSKRVANKLRKLTKLTPKLTNQGIAIHDVFGYNSSLVGESSSGRTADSGSVSRGSNPRSPARITPQIANTVHQPVSPLGRLVLPPPCWV